MKVVTKSGYNETDYRSWIVITRDWKTIVSFYEWEHEDNNLWRNFSDCFNIADLLEEFYELWNAWVNIEFIKEDKVDWHDLWE